MTRTHIGMFREGFQMKIDHHIQESDDWERASWELGFDASLPWCRPVIGPIEHRDTKMSVAFDKWITESPDSPGRCRLLEDRAAITEPEEERQSRGIHRFNPNN